MHLILIVVGVLASWTALNAQETIDVPESEQQQLEECNNLPEDEKLACKITLLQAQSNGQGDETSGQQVENPCEKKGGKGRMVACGIGLATRDGWGWLLLAIFLAYPVHWVYDRLRSRP